MFFTLEELVKWLGVTVFEMWLNLASLLIFTILLCLKLEGAMTTSWWNVFVPLFLADGLNAYFCVIVFIRMYKEGLYKKATARLASSVVCLVCVFVFKLLFCQKLSAQNSLSYSEVFASLFVALQILLVRACQIN
ncbi:hypothetical protein CAPTEDRAFT_178898 [Capitella teleta]|uniref:Transmembrane protein 203 n=1 Tax=Capitella teleta TaxID=283909 RepID=R7TV23_CAPTE|nr:hypothetical protein CAPTEDRAFT_178898 [Capitella teleta]|eukprot:ELT97574.1 hypothetical protein CAPTEDRAFT_178898 [Capitella teleta]